MDETQRRQVGLWRYGVLGPLVSARLEHGDVRAHLRQAASRIHRMPDGTEVTLSERTLEGWLYEYRRGGWEALIPALRSDRNVSQIRKDLAELILRAKAERPRRSINRIIRILERAKLATHGELSRSAVHRLLQSHKMSWRPSRGQIQERRSFISENAGDLWVGDSMHGPMVIGPDRKLHKSYLLTQIDCATRFAPYSYFAIHETAVAQEYGLKQAILRFGLPLAYYVDRGPAYIADSLRFICAELRTQLLHTASGDAPAKGVIERWHRTVRDELLDELSEEPIDLGDLNSKLWAWLAVEYHARKHDTTERIPRQHFLEQADQLRALPRGKNLDQVFLHRVERKVRNDGTVRWKGGYLEVRAELTGSKIELRFDPSDDTSLPKVFVDDRFFCDTVVQDRLANNYRKRSIIQMPIDQSLLPTGLDALGLIEAEHYQHNRPVLPNSTDDDKDES